MLLQNTYGWDILAGVVMPRRKGAHSGHLGSPEPVLLWAHETNQRGRRRGSDRQLIGLLAPVPESHLQHPRSIQQLSRSRGAAQGTALELPADDAW